MNEENKRKQFLKEKMMRKIMGVDMIVQKKGRQTEPRRRIIQGGVKVYKEEKENRKYEYKKRLKKVFVTINLIEQVKEIKGDINKVKERISIYLSHTHTYTHTG